MSLTGIVLCICSLLHRKLRKYYSFTPISQSIILAYVESTVYTGDHSQRVKDLRGVLMSL